MRALNLYAGLGGNRLLWPPEVSVTALERDPDVAACYQSLFPGDQVIVGDAHQYLLEHHHEFDFIWSSPPCQSHSRLNNFTPHEQARRRYPDLRLYEEIIFLRHRSRAAWVVENVKPYYEPLIPAAVCGRHLVWSSFQLPDVSLPPRASSIADMSPRQIADWLGLPVPPLSGDKGRRRRQALRNCVHPEMGRAFLLEALAA